MATTTTSRPERRDIDLSQGERIGFAKKIGEVLAETYRLTVETQILHWNVRGPLFLAAHELSERHYKLMFAQIDEIAERARALGVSSPAQAEAFPPPVRFDAKDVTAEQAIERLSKGHEDLVKRLRETADILEEEGDLGTSDFFVGLLQFHEKAIWMWRALIAPSQSKI